MTLTGLNRGGVPAVIPHRMLTWGAKIVYWLRRELENTVIAARLDVAVGRPV
jgi:hypothetical protein